MATKESFDNALTLIRDRDNVLVEDIAKKIKVPRSTIDNMRAGKQKVRRDVLEKIIAQYPQFGEYLEQRGGDDGGQSSPPDEQAEQLKQMLLDMQQIVADYAKRNSILEEKYIQMTEKYTALLEELRK